MNWKAGVALGVLAFAGGGLAVSWLASSGISPWEETPSAAATSDAIAPDPAPPTANPMTAAPLVPQIVQPIADSARTEAMLVTMAARRAINAGAPLAELAPRLQNSFGASQPQALARVIAADSERLTPPVLLAEFDRIAPDLAREPEMNWKGLQREFATLFVLRRGDAAAPDGGADIQRARDFIASGNVENALRFIEAMPGAANARAFTDRARRYVETQKALDALEAAALTMPVAPVAPSAPATPPEPGATPVLAPTL